MADYSPRQLEIMNAAIELIAFKGIQGLTTKNLALELKLTEGALYRHFSSKFDILLAILSNFQANAKQDLEKVCSNEDPAMEHIEQIFMKRFQSFTEKPAVASVIFSESIFQNDKRLSKKVFELVGNHEEVLNCIIEKGQKSQEFRNDISAKEIVNIIIGYVRYFITRWRLSGFEFDLIAEGNVLLTNIKTLIKK